MLFNANCNDGSICLIATLRFDSWVPFPRRNAIGKRFKISAIPPEALKMQMARLNGSQILLLGCMFFVAIGTLMEYTNPLAMTDFQQIYFGARSATHHYDPYNSDELAAFYRADTGSVPADDSFVAHTFRQIVLVANNLPTTLFLVAPLSIFSLKLAAFVWMMLIEGCFIFACVRIWICCTASAPRFSAVLVSLLLLNSGLLLSCGNTAGLVISLTAIAVSCFVADEFVVFGICCLAIALVVKPHDAGPVWLYFLLVGGSQRKRALYTLAVAAAITVPALVWISHVAPHWLAELQSNIAAGFAPGGINNPGPATLGGRGIGMIISLQSVLTLIWNNATFYTLASYLVCGILFVLWAAKTVRSGFSPRMAWLALAAISALTMLPMYHRTYDARLLLISIPACATLWSQSGSRRKWAMSLNLAGIVLTGDLFWIGFFGLTHYSGAALVFGMIPGPVALLAVATFYLCIYLRSPAPARVAATPDARGEIGLAASYAR